MSLHSVSHTIWEADATEFSDGRATATAEVNEARVRRRGIVMVFIFEKAVVVGGFDGMSKGVMG